MHELVGCFKPILWPDTRVLILGSVPGKASLEQNRYYAHPQNQFWRLLGGALEDDRLSDYRYVKRLYTLLRRGVGVWAAIAYCDRVASSDASIRNAVPIDLPAALKVHSVDGLRAVFFDGRKAEQVFMKKAYPKLPGHLRENIHFQYLPSSSPAWAAMSIDEKLSHWKTIQDYL